MRQRAVIVAGRFESDDDGPADCGQLVREPVIVRLRRHHGHTATAAAFRSLKENLLAVLRHIDRYQHGIGWRSEEHTSELQSLMRISYAVFCLNKKNRQTHATVQYTTTQYEAHN